jgi:aspartate kinase
MREGIARYPLRVGMRTHSGVAAKMFETLAKHDVNIMMIHFEIKISRIIDAIPACSKNTARDLDFGRGQ